MDSASLPPVPPEGDWKALLREVGPLEHVEYSQEELADMHLYASSLWTRKGDVDENPPPFIDARPRPKLKESRTDVEWREWVEDVGEAIKNNTSVQSRATRARLAAEAEERRRKEEEEKKKKKEEEEERQRTNPDIYYMLFGERRPY